MATTSSTVAASSKSGLQKLLNFRDVGVSVNDAAGAALLKTGLLFRSGRPDDATPLDRMRLSTHYALKTIVDLRTDSEHADQAARNKLKTDAAPEVLRIPGATYRAINFNGRAFSIALIRQLSYWNLAKLVSLYALGYRHEAISVMGVNVMAGRGLVGLAEDSLAHCTAEIKAVFDILADEANYPVLIHCTQGKDRTGLSVLLVLLLLGMPDAAIKQDYIVSESELAPGREAHLVDIRSIGLPEEFAGCPDDWTEKVTVWLQENYGGAEAYLTEHCGVEQAQIAAIRRILLPAGG